MTDPIPVRAEAALECRTCGAGAPVDEHFCPNCSRLLALGRHGDYFSFLGLAYFISSRVSFSLWSLYLLTEIIAVQQRIVGGDMPVGGAAWGDQHLGSSVAFLLGVLWIGRHH